MRGLCFLLVLLSPVISVSIPGIVKSNITVSFDTNSTDLSRDRPATIPGVWDGLNWSLFRPVANDGPSYYCDYICGIISFWRACFGNGITSSPGPASVSSVYDNSRVLFFDLKSFGVGCAATQNLTNELPPPYQLPPPGNLYKNPSNCTVTVKGYHVAPLIGAPRLPADVEHTFRYEPVARPDTNLPPLKSAAMQYVYLPASFRSLQYVEVNATSDTFSLSDPSVYTDAWNFVLYNTSLHL